MVASYPITAKRSAYRGADPQKREKSRRTDAAAAEIEQHVNDRLSKVEPGTYSLLYYEIASATGYSEEQVRDALFSVDGGHNGLTVTKN
jgi:hypothetical protein